MADFWQYDFMRYTLFSALLLGPACALLGVFVILRGMAFFSDAIAHSAVTGVALGFLLQEMFAWPLQPMLVVLIFSFLLATSMAWLQERVRLRPDTIIAFSFTGSVALGYIIINQLGRYRLIDAVLFGSIYSNTLTDLLLQGLLALTIVGFLLWNMRAYTLSMLQPDFAHLQGVSQRRLNYLFALLIAATVTICLKMVGALLLSALIVIPASAARIWAVNFRQMLVLAPLFGMLAAMGGVLFSFHADSPTGPTIVMANVTVLLLCLLASGFKSR